MAKHFIDSVLFNMADTRLVVCLYKWPWTLLWSINGNSYSYSCLCECSLTTPLKMYCTWKFAENRGRTCWIDTMINSRISTFWAPYIDQNALVYFLHDVVEIWTDMAEVVPVLIMSIFGTVRHCILSLILWLVYTTWTVSAACWHFVNLFSW